jgi:hypothetical protein
LLHIQLRMTGNQTQCFIKRVETVFACLTVKIRRWSSISPDKVLTVRGIGPRALSVAPQIGQLAVFCSCNAAYLRSTKLAVTACVNSSRLRDTPISHYAGLCGNDFALCCFLCFLPQRVCL